MTKPAATETQKLFRPIGKQELALIKESGFLAFPPRLPSQPYFYPVLQKEYAIQIARDWNTKDQASGHMGFVTRFFVKSAFLAPYPIQTVGAGIHQEYWIPAEDLDTFNRHIVGTIEIIEEFLPTPLTTK